MLHFARSLFSLNRHIFDDADDEQQDDDDDDDASATPSKRRIRFKVPARRAAALRLDLARCAEVVESKLWSLLRGNEEDEALRLDLARMVRVLASNFRLELLVGVAQPAVACWFGVLRELALLLIARHEKAVWSEYLNECLLALAMIGRLNCRECLPLLSCKMRALIAELKQLFAQLQAQQALTFPERLRRRLSATHSDAHQARHGAVRQATQARHLHRLHLLEGGRAAQVGPDRGVLHEALEQEQRLRQHLALAGPLQQVHAALAQDHVERLERALRVAAELAQQPQVDVLVVGHAGHQVRRRPAAQHTHHRLAQEGRHHLEQRVAAADARRLEGRVLEEGPHALVQHRAVGQRQQRVGDLGHLTVRVVGQRVAMRVAGAQHKLAEFDGFCAPILAQFQADCRPFFEHNTEHNSVYISCAWKRRRTTAC